MESLRSFGFDGRAALRNILESSVYGSLEQAVASLAAFSHPSTVAQAKARGIFRIIRDQKSRHQFAQLGDFGQVMMDDNKGPTDAFIWANQISRQQYEDVQFNHIWSESKDPDSYTNLANICMMPAFLSKLTDTERQVVSLLKYRSFLLFGWHPKVVQAPIKPAGFDSLNWAAPLPAIENLEAVYRLAMSRKPKDTTTSSARKCGWVFSDYHADSSL